MYLRSRKRRIRLENEQENKKASLKYNIVHGNDSLKKHLLERIEDLSNEYTPSIGIILKFKND